MFLKNNMRPALAGVSDNGQAARKARKNDAFMYDAGNSETDDFGSFSSGSSGNSSRKDSKKSQGGLNVKAIAIAAAALVAVVLLIVLVVAFAGGSSGSGIKYADNAFVAYLDSNDSWCVSANGKPVATYENEIELIVAKDRSFAYIVEESEEGYRVILTNGKETKEITQAPVADVLTYAGLEPGVVWLDEDKGISVWNEKYGEERIINAEKLANVVLDVPNSFIISDDAMTVAYLRLDEGVQSIYTYTHSDFSSKVGRTSGAFPAALSADGSMLYFYGQASETEVSATLRATSLANPDDRFDVAKNFTGIVAMNVAGDEIVYTAATATNDGTPVTSTNVVKVDVKKLTVSEPVQIVKGATYEPMSIDPEIAVLDTFGDAYFKAPDSLVAELATDVNAKIPIYRLSKNYFKENVDVKIKRVSQFNGEFDPNGDYYYFINAKNVLCYVDLDDIDAGAMDIATDIIDFEVTQKGNLYLLEDTNTLKYYKVSAENTTRIADGVAQISMHDYANTLYFTYTDADETYCTKEGSDKELAKFGKASAAGIPHFTSATAKCAYAGFLDDETEEWTLFYTSNGKTFKSIGNCSEIEGLEYSVYDAIKDALDDLLPDNTDGNTDGDNNESEGEGNSEN